MTPEERLQQMIEAARETGTGGDGWDEFAGRAHRALLLRRAAVVTGTLALVVAGALSAVALVGDDSLEPTPVGPAEGATESPELSAEPTPPGTSPTSAASPTEEPPAASVEPFEAELWFVAGEKLSFGTTIVPLGEQEVSSRLEPGSAAQRAAVVLEGLLGGPPGAYQEAGDHTAIPEGTRLLDLRVDDGIAIVDLSNEFESGGGSLSMQLRIAQVVYTATQIDGVDGVRFAIEGREVDSIGGEGVIVDDPIDRSDFVDVAPPIVLLSPKTGSRVSTPVVVAGHADVFEATVNIRILDEDGKVLTETFTTATCGSGCRGEFSKSVKFSVDREQPGRVVAFTYSAEDGSQQHPISVPVTLTP